MKSISLTVSSRAAWQLGQDGYRLVGHLWVKINGGGGNNVLVCIYHKKWCSSEYLAKNGHKAESVASGGPQFLVGSV